MENKKEKISILLVEDERPLQKAIKLKLKREDFDVVTATDVDQALNYLEDKDIEISAVWLDHYLFGKKDGLDFLAIANERDLIEEIPVFVVTNTGGEEKRQTYVELGAKEYYIKSDNKLEDIILNIKESISKKIN